MSTSKGVAIVTGSAQGIGKAIVLRLASDGYDIALFDLPSQQGKLEELVSAVSIGIGRKAIAVTGDVTIEKDVEGVVKETADKLGSVDVVRELLDASMWLTNPVSR